MASFFFALDLAFDPGDVLAADTGTGQALAVSLGNPSLPNPWAVEARLLEFAHDLVPPLGGQAQRITRLGSRWSLTFRNLPAMGIPCGRALIGLRAKMRANGDSGAFLWPQPGFAGAIGAPAVNGAGQTGCSLAVKGLTPSTPLLVAGTFFSFVVGARNYLHALTANAVVDGGGNATLSIAPMLRASPADGAALQAAQPAIEGFIEGQAEAWTLERLAWHGLPAFTVTEVQ